MKYLTIMNILNLSFKPPFPVPVNYSNATNKPFCLPHGVCAHIMLIS